MIIQHSNIATLRTEALFDLQSRDLFPSLSLLIGNKNTLSTFALKKTQLKARSIFVAILLILSNLIIDVDHIEPAFAVTETGMSCVSKHCFDKFSKCSSDQNCIKGIQCFTQCSIKDSIGKTKNIEGMCQARCMDLFESELLNSFTDCVMTENRCFPPLEADPRYPILSREMSDKRLLHTSTKFQNELKQLLLGKWYISAGLNPAYDIFDCQEHYFFPSKSTKVSDQLIVDAEFHYRVPQGGNKFFTKVGLKRLQLVDYEEMNACSVVYTREDGKKWGIDDTHQLSTDSQPNRESDKYDHHHLQLTLRPDKLNYKDDWTILSYDLSSGSEFFIVAYRGANSAASGYGGLNLYTRSPINIAKFMDTNTLTSPEKQMLDGIEKGLEKLNLSLKDLIAVDNSCSK